MCDLNVCVGCLVTDVKMFNMTSVGLLLPYERLTGLQYNDIEPHDPPQKLCWECAALVNKFNTFRLKCERAHTLLRDAYMIHGEMSLDVIGIIDRTDKNLISSLVLSSITAQEIALPAKRIDKNKSKKTLDKLKKRKHKSKDKIEAEQLPELEIELKEEKVEVKTEREDDSAFVEEADNIDNELPEPCIDYSDADIPEIEEKELIPEIKEIVKNAQKMSKKIQPKKTKRIKREKNVKEKKKKVYQSKRKTPKLYAIDFGMKEENLTQEQQIQVMLDRKKASAYVKSRYHCELCYRAFSDMKAFNNHQVLHDKVAGEFVCDICKLRYKTRLTIARHMIRHHAKKYTCVTCNEVFYTRSYALKHHAWHKGVTYTCHICGASYRKRTSHQNHLRNKHPQGPVCVECGQAFVSEKGLHQHMQLMHLVKRDESESGQPGPYCSECSVQFNSQEAWVKHVLTTLKHKHEKRLLCANGCDMCGKVLPDAQALFKHRAEHRKMNAIENPEPISCEQCGQQMENSREYHSHFRRYHPDKTRTHYPAMKAPAMCELCGKVFQNKVHLRLHSYVHTGERPFKCDVCSKSFNTPSNLGIHKRIHTKEQPYMCNICGQGFSNRSNMNRHRMVHTDAKPHSCDTCGKSFKSRSTVRSHVEYVHMKKPWPKRDRARGVRTNDEYILS